MYYVVADLEPHLGEVFNILLGVFLKKSWAESRNRRVNNDMFVSAVLTRRQYKALDKSRKTLTDFLKEQQVADYWA